MLAAVAMWLVGCSAAPHESTTGAVLRTPPPVAAPPAVAVPDPDLHHPPPRRVLDIDWAAVAVTGDADADALWQRIAPTGADWDDKLDEVPEAVARPLAIALLHGGNLTCMKPRTARDDCTRPLYEVDRPAETAGLADPCLRRLLALWSLRQLDASALPEVKPAVLAIAAIPPPESELLSAAVDLIPDSDPDARLAFVAAAWRAGQHEIASALAGTLDEPHQIEAVKRFHVAGALEMLSPQAQRAVYLAAVTDDALEAAARSSAISELAADAGDKLDADLQAALVAAAGAKDCGVAAAAARVLDQHGDHRFVPRRPATGSVDRLMHAVCVLASYEALQQSDEPSLLISYVPARGLERYTITYDALSDTDPDGDGDPHTTHSAQLVPRGEVVLPEVEDLVRAMQHCAGTVCVSDDHEFRFVWTRAPERLLSRIELADRPPCTARP